MAIVFALGAFFLWGLADVFAALSSRKVGNIATFVVIQLVGLILFALLFPFFAGTFESFYFFIAFILAVVDSLGLIFFYKAFEEGNVSLNGTIAGSFGLVTVIIALVFFGETLSILAEAGILLVFVGLVMATLKFKELLQNNLAKSFSDRGVIFALLTMLCWGVYFGFLRIPVEKIGWYWTMLPLSFMLPFIIVFPSIRKNIKQSCLVVCPSKCAEKWHVVKCKFGYERKRRIIEFDYKKGNKENSKHIKNDSSIF